jgi:hypothetical protein
MSIIKQEVAGLVGAYIRAWFYGAALGGALVAWLMMSQPTDLSLQPAFTAHPLPCWEQECLEAFGYTVKNKGAAVENDVNN